MSLRTVLGAASLALVVTSGAAQAQQLPPARQVFDRYLQAVGGPAVISRFNTRHTVVEMSMPAAGMTMTTHLYQARPNKMFARVEMPGLGSSTSGYDGRVAWSIDPMQGPRVLQGKELNDALTRATFDASLDPQQFRSMETVGERTVDGRACWNVKMVTTTGIEAHNCFDKETGLMIGSRAKMSTQMGEIEMESTLSDYRDFDGLKVATRGVASFMGQQVVTTVKSISHEPIPASTFELPAEIRALAGQQQ